MTARPHAPAASRDPLGNCLLIAAVFFLVVLIRLGVPTKPMFDEIHYLPAARNLLALSTAVNREHPLLGKEVLAMSMAVFGDNPFGWRIPSAILGTIGLFAGMRAIWLASRSEAATVLFGVLFATDFTWYIQSRIAMLDMVMAAFFVLAMWQAVAAWRFPERGRLHLALCGLFMGLSLAGKWTAAPLLALPGLTFAWLRWRASDRTLRGVLLGRGAAPVPAVSLLEAGWWLGAFPLVVYLATFIPYYFFEKRNLTSLWDLLALQHKMVTLQDSVVKPHTYMSRWWQWIFNIRPIWYLYENVDGAQRGVLLLGNPFSMLAAVPALLWCAWKGLLRGDGVKLGVFAAWALAVLYWAVNGKPVQFYYHYLIAGGFAMAALALVVGEWWDKDRRWPALIVSGLALVFAAWFFPIISAAELPGKMSYRTYTWFYSWR